jgi:hypothetical protein
MHALVVALAGCLVTLILAACGSGSDQGAEVREESAPTAPATHEELTAGRWRVEISVRPSRIGPIVLAVTNLARAKPANSDPWIEHDLVVRNTGDQPVTFADTRGSEFIGDAGHHRLLVVDEGCGYSRNGPRAAVTAGACRAYLDLLTVKPDASANRTITLFKRLPGMDPLSAGTYVFRRPVRFQPGSRQPGEREGRSGVVRVVYKIASPSG